MEPDTGLTAERPLATAPRQTTVAGGSSEWRVVIASVVPAVVVTAALFAWMLHRSSAGTNTAGLQMTAMDLQHRVAYWWPFLMGETLGIAALIWSYLSVLLGLMFSARSPRLGLTRRRMSDLHRYVSLTGLALIAGHVFFVAVGSMNGAMTTRTVDWKGALLPFQESWNGQFYDVGVFAFYLAILLGPTYYLRRWIGERTWRTVHRASLAVYVLSVWHTFGFDDFDFHGSYRLTLWIAQIPLAALMLWRLWSPTGSARSLRRTALVRVAAGAATVVVLVWVVMTVASGRIGGSPSPFH